MAAGIRAGGQYTDPGGVVSKAFGRRAVAHHDGWRVRIAALMLAHPDIDPVAIAIGPLAVRWYGISYVLGIGGAWWLLHRRAARREHWSAEQVADLVFFAAIGVVLGGRVGYALFYQFGSYLRDPLGLLRIWEGGMSFHGGLLGVMVAIVWFARREGKTFLDVADWLVPVVPLGLMCGRIGNFINGELWGAPSTLPWAMVFRDPLAGGVPRHPSQLYQAALEGLLLFVILWWLSSRPRARGLVSGAFLVGYGVFRGLVEFVRVPDAHLGYLAFGWLTMGQVLCLPMIAAGLWLLLRARHQPLAGA